MNQDESLCTNTLCRIRDTCDRYMSIPYSYQSFTNFINECNDDSNFKMFVELSMYTKLRIQNEGRDIKFLDKQNNNTNIEIEKISKNGK